MKRLSALLGGLLAAALVTASLATAAAPASAAPTTQAEVISPTPYMGWNTYYGPAADICVKGQPLASATILSGRKV